MTERPELELGVYRHFKGNLYRVTSLARDTETLEWYVVYQTEEKAGAKIQVWVRPYAMFVETVERQGKNVARFQYVNA